MGIIGIITKSKPTKSLSRWRCRKDATHMQPKVYGVHRCIRCLYVSGSRPNQTPTSWGLARLASVILGGPSRRIDKDIWLKYKR